MLKRRRGDRLGSHAEAPRQLAHGGWRTIIRHGLPGIAATILGVVLSIAVALAGGPPPSAYCIDPNNGIKYVSADGQRYYWYAQVQTANGGCNSNGCPYVYTYTQGGKGNLNTGGLPYTWDDAVQHVSEWMGSYENPAHCTTSNQTGTGGCWVQLGWTVGYASSCGGTIDPTSVTVYVEIYDDSSSPCYLATYGGAPSNASYDARFYTTLGNGLHRYQVYYEVPGSNNIQDLAIIALGTGIVAATPDSQPFLGTPASPQVHAVIQLGNPSLHPRQLAYDPARNGIWFWTSTQERGTTFDNRVYFYDIGRAQLRSWPIYSGDWSSQLLAGLAVAPNGEVWIGWNLNLICFHPGSGIYTRYTLPPSPQYPLPAAVLGDLPANLGVADLAVGRDGTVWIARYGALSLTAFDPATATFAEYPLPLASGDPARLSIAPGGDIFFTTDLAANHPGFGQETVGEFSPQTRLTWVYPQGAETIALTPQGDLYAAVGGPGYRLARLSATERAAAMAQHRVPVFQQQVTAFAIDGTALAADAHGRVWMAVAGQPRVAVLDPASGAVQFYQYAAPSVAAHPASSQVFGLPRTAPAPGTVWLVHIVAMTTDGQGHLWYVRAGSNVIEQVRA